MRKSSHLGIRLLLRRSVHTAPQRLAFTPSLREKAPAPIPESPSTPALRDFSEADNALIQRDEFYGVASVASTSTGPPPKINYELEFTRLHEWSRTNGRIRADTFLRVVLLPLERGEDGILSVLRSDPKRWVPRLVSFTGRPLSTVACASRRILAERMWSAVLKHELPLCAAAFNAHLEARLDNEEDWDAERTFKDMKTFLLLLQRLAQSGTQKKDRAVRAMVYEMAARGMVVDSDAHATFVHSATIAGDAAQADQLIQETLEKCGEVGEVRALGAAAKAAASIGDSKRLKEILRRSVNGAKKLRLPHETAFDIVWELSKQPADAAAVPQLALIDEIIKRTTRPQGYFRYLFREIQRHIADDRFYTATSLFCRLMEIGNALNNQQRIAFLVELMGRACRQLVRSGQSPEKIREHANRLASAMPTQQRRLVYDNLAQATLLYKKYDMDERLAGLAQLIDQVDAERQRPHLLLPILAAETTLDSRLRALFRSSTLGYANFHELDASCMRQHILTPLFLRSRYHAREQYENKKSAEEIAEMALKEVVDVLVSYGMNKESVWHLFHAWWQEKRAHEVREGGPWNTGVPRADQIKNWLRSDYNTTFPENAAAEHAPPALTDARLQAVVAKDRAADALLLVEKNGWPLSTNLAETAPKILKASLVRDIGSRRIMKFVRQLSQEAERRESEAASSGEPLPASPLASLHLLQIVHFHMTESDVTTRMSGPAATELCYELAQLFPRATYPKNRLESRYSMTATVASNIIQLSWKSSSSPALRLPDTVELVRSLMKLELIPTYWTEKITPLAIYGIFLQYGWEDAVRLWKALHSQLSLSNGLINLLHLAYGSRNSRAERDEKIKDMTHSALRSLPAGRIHCFRAVAFIRTTSIPVANRDKEAEKVFAANAAEIKPIYCADTFGLYLALTGKTVRRTSLTFFPELCFKYVNLAEDKEAAQAMLGSALNRCALLRDLNLSDAVCELFASHGIEPTAEQKAALKNSADTHHEMLRRWVFAPSGGLLRIEEGDPLLSLDGWKEHVACVNTREEPVSTFIRAPPGEVYVRREVGTSV